MKVRAASVRHEAPPLVPALLGLLAFHAGGEGVGDFLPCTHLPSFRNLLACRQLTIPLKWTRSLAQFQDHHWGAQGFQKANVPGSKPQGESLGGPLKRLPETQNLAVALALR